MRRRTQRTITYLLYLAAVLVVTNYIFFLFFRSDLKEESFRASFHEIKYVTKEILSKVGWISTKKDSQFVNFPQRKENGVIRIGAFGDSQTYGDEVDETNDYPSLLQSIFKDHYYENIEVINFGSSGYGFNQSYMMWEMIGRKFDLDFILLGPHCFHPLRDTTFLGEEILPILMHSRYVLDGERGVRRYDIAGLTYDQQFEHYYSFLPPWHILRYERLAPPFLKSLIVLENRALGNPFYYKKDFRGEAIELYSRLLKKMSGSGKQIVVIHQNGDIHRSCLNLAAQPGSNLNANPKLSELDRYGQYGFPYWRFGGHRAPLGNRIVAKHYFDILTGKEFTSGSFFEFYTLDHVVPDTSALQNIRMEDIIDFNIGIDDHPIGEYTSTLVPGSKEQWAHITHKEFVRMVKSGVMQSVLIIKNKKRSYVNMVVVPLDYRVDGDVDFVMQIHLRGKISNWARPGQSISTRPFACCFWRSRGYSRKSWEDSREKFPGASMSMHSISTKEKSTISDFFSERRSCFGPRYLPRIISASRKPTLTSLSLWAIPPHRSTLKDYLTKARCLSICS